MSYIIKFFIILSYCAITYAYVSQNPHLIQDDINKCISKVDSINNDALNCDIHTVEHHNNEIYILLSQLLQKPYFKFFKVNLNKKCPFWPDNRICASQNCFVKTCDKDSVPSGLREVEDKYGTKTIRIPSCVNKEHNGNNSDDELNGKSKELLNAVNHTISSNDRKAFEEWNEYDSTAMNFCELDDDSSSDCEYVDLLLNPEQFTAYSGYASHRIWQAIYEENCFHQNDKSRRRGYGLSHESIKNLCFEKRAFYMALSGLHSSISIHLCSRYYFPGESSGGPVETEPAANNNLNATERPKTTFHHNPVEFCKRFDIENTHGEGPMRLRNLYFTYLLEMRALAKIAHYLEDKNYYTGNDEDDRMVNQTMRALLRVIKSFPCHFEEHLMFQGNNLESRSLKVQFREHFRNISRIMDCVSCDKCRLWGKLQTQGLGTALKILFGTNVTRKSRQHFRLKRGEVVALINAFGRLSNSIHEISTYYRSVSESEIAQALSLLNAGKSSKPPFIPLTTTTFGYKSHGKEL